jgi:hypothetical protein
LIGRVAQELVQGIRHLIGVLRLPCPRGVFTVLILLEESHVLFLDPARGNSRAVASAEATLGDRKERKKLLRKSWV